MTPQEQKTLFAERLRRRPNDALMIMANILGKDCNPLEAITLANSWPNDPFVLSEIKRFNEVPTSKGERLVELHEHAKTCMNRGEEKAAVEFYKLIVQMEGHINKSNDDGKGNDRLEELAAMIVDRDDIGNG